MMVTDFFHRLPGFLQQHRPRLHQLAVVLLGGLALYALLHNLHHCVAQPYDLRNRLVGARMLKDGLSPYFYQWQRGNAVRYYNPNGFWAPGGIYTSEATGTPFVHLLLRPFAELTQLQFNIAWFVLQYLALAGTVVALCKRLGARYHLPVTAAAVIFTYSVGWQHQVFQGQLYMFLSLFMAWMYYYTTAPVPTVFSIGSAALFAVLAVLTRPAFVLFLVPFIFQYSTYRRYAVAVTALLLLWVAFACFHTVQRHNWADYFRLVQLHSHMHVAGATEAKGSYRLLQFEGVDTVTDGYNEAAKGVVDGVEETAAYLLLNRLGLHPSVGQLLAAGCLLVVLIVAPLFSSQRRKAPLLPNQLFLLGFCTFFLFDFFSPVARSTYYFCLWLFPVLLFFAVNKNRPLQWLAAVGLLLNIVILPQIKMEHTIGQFCLLLAFMLFTYRRTAIPVSATGK